MGDLERLLSQTHTVVGARAAELRTVGVWGVPGGVPTGMLAKRGFPSVVPLWWNGRGVFVGLRMLPDAPVAAWRPVLVQEDACTTLGETAAGLVPALLAVRVLEGGAANVDRLVERWPAHRSAAMELHRVLGGHADVLDAVLAHVASPGARVLALHPEGRAGLCAQVWAIGSNGGSLDAFADWVNGPGRAPASPPPEREPLGAWWRRAAMRWAWSRFCNPGAGPLPRVVLEDLLLVDAGCDDGNVEQSPWLFSFANSGASEAAQSAAAMVWEQGDASPTGDAAGESVARALLDPAGSDGEAHAQAAVLLDERGEPARAWGALCSAAWWATRALGECPAELCDGLRILATRRGWTDDLDGLAVTLGVEPG